MRQNSIRLICLSIGLCFTGCATPQLETPISASAEVVREAELQRKFAFDYQKDQRLLLARVGYRLAVSGAELCGERVTGMSGFWIWSAKQFSRDDAEIARRHYGLGDGMIVMDVIDGSPAHASGLRAGDHIVTLAGVTIPAVSDDLLRTVETKFRSAFRERQPILAVISRGDETQTLSISPLAACDYELRINQDEAVNAFADGERIVVNAGLLNFVRSEQELALVLSHELSHNFLGHVDSRKRNSLVGGGLGLVLGALVAGSTGVDLGLYRTGSALGAQAYSVEFEQEADYAGLYVMRRAGYDIVGAAELWRRVAAQNPRQINIRSTHPTSPERFVAIESSLNEISSKERANEPLVPNLKKALTKK